MLIQRTVYADWCGPCKVISPTFESLSAKHSKPNKITFTKVNVDNQQAIAQKYGIRAYVPRVHGIKKPDLANPSHRMPTFLIFRSGSVIETIKGADSHKLTSAVENAVKLAGAAATPLYSTPGRTLGGAPSVSQPLDIHTLFDAIITFFGLYFTSLFSLDAYAAAENSPFNKNRPAQSAGSAPTSAGKTAAGKPAPQSGRRLGTIADIAGDN